MLDYLEPATAACPELDNGRSFKGRLVYSSRLWIPETIDERWDSLIDERIEVTPLLRYDPRPKMKGPDGRVLRDSQGRPRRWGESPVQPINLSKNHEFHTSVPRELFPEILAQCAHTHTDYRSKLERVDFNSIIRPRDDDQAAAFRALELEERGVSHQACGKGKTICGLHRIAYGNAPGVITVSNGGIAWQWKSRAMEFLGLAEHEIGFVSGAMGAEAYAHIPPTLAGIEALLRKTDEGLTRTRAVLATYGGDEVSVTNTRHLVQFFCGTLRLEPRSISPSSEPTVRKVDVEWWAEQGVPAAIALVEHYALLRRQKTLLEAARGIRPHWWRKLVIVMLPTLVNRLDSIPMSIRQRFGTALSDEAHHLPASTFSRTADLFFGNRYCLTATPGRSDGLESIMFAHNGPVIYKNTVPDDPATVYVKALESELDLTDDDVAYAVLSKVGEVSVGMLNNYLADYADRNWQIITHVLRALRSGRRIIVLVHAAKHPGILSEDLDARAPGEFTACVVTGSTPPADRTGLIASHQVTFATIGVATEGLDAPSLDTIFFATPFRAWPIFIQGKGRVERLFDGKKNPLAIVLHDPHIGLPNGMTQGLMREMKKREMSYAT